MGSRLAAVASDLSARLESLTEDDVRRQVSVAIHAAVVQTGLTDPTIAQALDLDGCAPAPALRSAVEALAARAASAVLFSLDPDVRGSADDAIYEAQAALGSVESLRTHMSL